MKEQNHIGHTLNTFSFIRVIGEGAWAKVYQAIDLRDRKTVAIKVIPMELIRKTPKLNELIKT